MGKLSRFNPSGGIADFWNEFRKPTPYRWPILLTSLAIPLTSLYLISQERHLIPPERPTIDYITSFEPGRSDSEIVASNIENQKRKEAEQARIAALEEEAKDAYRALGRATGVDVDAMEREIAEEKAREEAAAGSRRQAPTSQTQSPDNE
ncbi:hypothetical protein WAB17_02905 [Parerythrobacter aurantius]|uniref:hypothetical protein n=1 Tax=Parerythrobacter aurantius TaxID=3127706 RepID=UPI00324CDE38